MLTLSEDPIIILLIAHWDAGSRPLEMSFKLACPLRGLAIAMLQYPRMNAGGAAGAPSFHGIMQRNDEFSLSVASAVSAA